MKRKILITLFIGIFSIIIFPFSSVQAKNISTLDVVNNNNKISVSGITENGVLAVAILVYSGDNLIYMETCPSNNNKYSCELNKNFDLGSYMVKVADYDGGDYISKNIDFSENIDLSEKAETPVENIKNRNEESNPKTGDNIYLYYILGLISIIGFVGTILYRRKKIN